MHYRRITVVITVSGVDVTERSKLGDLSLEQGFILNCSVEKWSARARMCGIDVVHGYLLRGFSNLIIRT